MKYPEWAPQMLVDLHMRRTDNESLDGRKFAFEPETIIAHMVHKNEGLTEEDIDNIRSRLYRNVRNMALPNKESTELLELLITDLRMMDAWNALIRRVVNDQEFGQFFRACECGIAGWRGDPKQTAAERRASYQEIRDTAVRLQSLMRKSSGFHFYSICDLVEDQHITCLLENVNSIKSGGRCKTSDARFYLSGVMPSTIDVLNDIGNKATQYGEEVSSVKKPNSPNAKIHYFIRHLSCYCQRQYKQPLHETVAITTSVIFDQMNIDTDYVRKIVKR